MKDDENADIYAAQREELLTLLTRMKRTGEPLVVHGERRLNSEDAAAILQKLGRGFGFSRKERAALVEAGFDLAHLYPDH